jgi:hypothetical protein
MRWSGTGTTHEKINKYEQNFCVWKSEGNVLNWRRILKYTLGEGRK